MNMKRGIKAYLTPIVAIGLGGIAAVISILGMSKLFAGHALIVMIVMAFIEAGKIIGTTILHDNWKIRTYRIIKWPLLLMVIVAMAITSWGIYGFFTDAYQKTAGKLSVTQTEVQLIENKKIVLTKSIDNLENQVEFKDKQSIKLLEVRTQQEERLKTYSKQEGWAAYNNSKRTQKQIDEANENLLKIQEDITTMYSEINALNDSIGKLDIEILDKGIKSEAAAELGPLLYIAKVFNSDMDNIINFVMVFIMFVFDPLAIILIIVTSKMWAKNEGVVVDGLPMNDLIGQEPNTPLQKTISVQPLKTPLRNLIEVEEEEEDDYSLIEEMDPNDEFIMRKTIIPIEPIESKEEEPLTESIENKEEEPLTEPYPFKEGDDTPGDELNNTWQRIQRLRRNNKNGGNNGIIRLGD